MAKRGKKNLVLERVFDGIRAGCSLYQACLRAEISTKDFYEILEKDEAERSAYLLALADYADQCTDEIKSIAEDLKAGEIDNSTAKLLIETAKWLAQKAGTEPAFLKRSDDEVKDEAEATAEILVKFV